MLWIFTSVCIMQYGIHSSYHPSMCYLMNLILYYNQGSITYSTQTQIIKENDTFGPFKIQIFPPDPPPSQFFGGKPPNPRPTHAKSLGGPKAWGGNVNSSYICNLRIIQCNSCSCCFIVHSSCHQNGYSNQTSTYIHSYSMLALPFKV